MRKIYLENSIGERISLCSMPYFFNKISGFGMSKSFSYADIGKGFYKVSKTQFPTNNIVGEILIKRTEKTAYALYEELLDWTEKGYALNLIYAPDGTEYITQVEIEYITKTELVNYNLVCPVSFKSVTPFYKAVPQMLNLPIEVSGNVTRYPFIYNYSYLASASSGEIDIIASGHLPASLKIIANGVLYNPEIKLTGADGRVIGKCKLIDKTIESGEVLNYSSLYLSPGIDINGVSCIDELDLNEENFFSVPLSETCRLSVKSDGAVDVNATVYIYNYYRSV